MSAYTAGRYRVEAHVSISGEGSTFTGRQLGARILAEFEAPEDGSGGMLPQDIASNPNVSVIQERTDGRITVTMAMTVDVSPTRGWDNRRIAAGLANAMIQTGCVTANSVGALTGVFQTGRAASTDRALAPVTTGGMSVRRLGAYPTNSTAARRYGVQPTVVAANRASGGTTANPKGGALTAYTPAELAAQYQAKGAALFGGDDAPATAEPVAPATLPVVDRAGLGDVVSSTDPGMVGKGQGIVSVATFTDATRTATGRVALSGLGLAIVVGAVLLWRKK